MCFIEIYIELLVMLEYFILLVKLNMPAHHNDRLPHEKHKKSAKQCKYQDRDTESGDTFIEAQFILIKFPNKI